MSRVAPVALLDRFGPASSSTAPASLAESRDYCRRLALAHYENFIVSSALLPRSIRPHFYAIYAYCRWADDLADETAGPEESLVLLDWWRGELARCYQGETRHPVFVALRETIDAFQIPQQPFLDLLDAFVQDQRQRRYDSFAQLLDYCRRSANPVGRLVLALGRVNDERRVTLSDSICTGLQLANFWQDVERDWRKDRIYLPRETLDRFGCDDRPWSTRAATPEFRRALAFEVDRAETFLREGAPLVDEVPPFLSGDVWLFAQGGLRVLDKIRRQEFDVWSRRPKVGKAEQLLLLARCWWRIHGPRWGRS